jgi:hypothetical protein
MPTTAKKPAAKRPSDVPVEYARNVITLQLINFDKSEADPRDSVSEGERIDISDLPSPLKTAFTMAGEAANKPSKLDPSKIVIGFRVIARKIAKLEGEEEILMGKSTTLQSHSIFGSVRKATAAEAKKCGLDIPNRIDLPCGGSILSWNDTKVYNPNRPTELVHIEAEARNYD